MTNLRRSRVTAAPTKPVANASGLTLYVAAGQIECDWVRLTLCEKEIDSARVCFVTPGRMNEDLALLNPALTLPTLADREGVLFGAAVIAEYLDERYPSPKLMPAAPAERARVRMALRRIENDLFPLVDPSGADRSAAASLRRFVRESLEAGERRFGPRSWFLGTEFSLADCAWAVLLQRLSSEALSASPSIRHYADRLFSRPAFRRYAGSSVQ